VVKGVGPVYEMDIKERAAKIVEILESTYKEAYSTLEFKDAFQLLLAAQLAAQCTDERVNIVTKDLFVKYPDVYAFAEADVSELEEDIKSTGFYRNKAKNIINSARMIIKDYGGEVPSKMEDLLKLPGVGRKTANLILGDWYGIPGIVVDTHAGRLSRRMGLTKHEDPEKVEYDLMKIIPEEKWTDFCHRLVFHGRAVCRARKPLCDECPVIRYCDYAQKSKGMKGF